MYTLSAMLLVFAMVPGLPMLTFLFLSGMALFMARALKDPQSVMPALVEAEGPVAARRALEALRVAAPMEPRRPPVDRPNKPESLLPLDTLQIELGYGLVSLADARRGGDLLERVTGVRRTFAQEMGMVVPPIRLRDNMQMGANEYRFLLKGNPVSQGELMPGHWLAMNATHSKTVLKGVPTTEPVFKLPATWITDSERRNAEIAGYTVVDAASVLVTHLSETVKRSAHEILTRQDVQNLLDNLKQTHPAVVNELIPDCSRWARSNACSKTSSPKASRSGTCPASWSASATTWRSPRIPTNSPNTPAGPLAGTPPAPTSSITGPFARSRSIRNSSNRSRRVSGCWRRKCRW